MLTVVQSLYKKNEYVNESARLTLKALNEVGVDYQYILFNDHGDESIIDDVKEFLNDKVEYHYSDINFGKGKCSGGWVGSLPLIKGDFVHNTGQDDIFSPQFYKRSLEAFNDPNIMACVSNGYKVNEELLPLGLMLNPQFKLPYETHPFECFKQWFGVGENGKDEVTRANNNFPAPGVVYRKSLHGLIGVPDLDEFFGAGDFEYWARIIFNDHKCQCILEPTWFYRVCKYSAGNEIIDGKSNGEHWNNIYIDRIKNKYYNLYKDKINGI